MHPSVAPLVGILDLNRDLLLNCLEGLSDDEARRRLAAGGNSAAFLAAHLTDTRHFLVARIGKPLFNPLSRYLADVRSIEDMREWPILDEIRDAWLAIGDHLATALTVLTPAELEREQAHRFPMGDSSVLGLIAFLVQHDSYHVGQVAFLRRQLGKPAMTYTRRPPGTSAVPGG